MLEEMEIDYEKIPVDMTRGAHLSPDYLNLNPTGQVPALGLPDGSVIGETAAIILTLGERHPESPLVPRLPDRNKPTYEILSRHPQSMFYLTYSEISGHFVFLGV